MNGPDPEQIADTGTTEQETDPGAGTGPMNPGKPGPDTTVRLAAMKRALGDAERVIVLTHDNPDPDAIASTAGLGYLLRKALGLPVTLAFGGIEAGKQ